jgi:hypothetical protein
MASTFLTFRLLQCGIFAFLCFAVSFAVNDQKSDVGRAVKQGVEPVQRGWSGKSRRVPPSAPNRASSPSTGRLRRFLLSSDSKTDSKTNRARI